MEEGRMSIPTQEQVNARLPTWARRLVLSGLCGSHVHGTYIPPLEQYGTDDVDVFQIIAHPRVHYLGLAFYRRAMEAYQTHGESLDIVVHELVKFVHLAAQGNPNVNMYLWLQPEEYLSVGAAGKVLLDNRDVFLSQRMFVAFGGYAYAQLKKMTAGERLGYMGAKRKLLMEQHGYDIKNAAHCIRLFYTALHLAWHSELKPRLTGTALMTVLDVKRGNMTIGAVERLAMDLDETFHAVRKSSALPVLPDPAAVDRVLRLALEAHWDTLQGDV